MANSGPFYFPVKSYKKEFTGGINRCIIVSYIRSILDMNHTVGGAVIRDSLFFYQQNITNVRLKGE